MNIAMLTDGVDFSGKISFLAKEAAWLVIAVIDDETLKISKAKSIKNTFSDTELAEKILEENCEASISGVLEPATFDLLVENGITRMNGAGLTAEEAIRKMNDLTIAYFIPEDDEHEHLHGHHHGSDASGCREH